MPSWILSRITSKYSFLVFFSKAYCIEIWLSCPLIYEYINIETKALAKMEQLIPISQNEALSIYKFLNTTIANTMKLKKFKKKAWIILVSIANDARWAVYKLMRLSLQAHAVYKTP